MCLTKQTNRRRALRKHSSGLGPATQDLGLGTDAKWTPEQTISTQAPPS